MTIGLILMFSGALAVACATPGPTTTALVSHVVSHGRGGAFAFCAGLVLGDLFWLLCAIFGVAALIATAEAVFTVIRWLGAAYLCLLAWKLWSAPATTPSDGVSVTTKGGHLVLGGLSIALGNPKTMLFYLALVPALLPIGSVAGKNVMLLAAIVVLVYGTILTAYVLLAAQMRRFLKSPEAARSVNRVAALVMAATAVFILLH